MPAPVHPASTVLLLRDGQQQVEVFMTVRHEAMTFMGGALVFPGGRLDAADRALAESYASLGLPQEAVALRIAAVRETFEEAGVLLARAKDTGQFISADTAVQLQSARHAVHDDSLEFVRLLERENLTLALDALIPYANWITPEGAVKRFDTHFFATVLPDGQSASHDGSESEESLWISPHDAISGGECGRYMVRFPTAMNLKLLLKAQCANDAVEIALKRPIVPVLSFMGADGKRQIPPEAGYDV